MVLVLVFIALLLSMVGVAFRHMGAATRVETARLCRRQRDEGTIHAAARGLALLETGLPPTDPYVCGVSIDTSTGTRSFTVTFTGQGGSAWSVGAAETGPYDTPPPMPATFAP
jgi:hypothetical protein